MCHCKGTDVILYHCKYCVIVTTSLSADSNHVYNDDDETTISIYYIQKTTYDIRLCDRNMARMSTLVFKVITGQ